MALRYIMSHSMTMHCIELNQRHIMPMYLSIPDMDWINDMYTYLSHPGVDRTSPTSNILTIYQVSQHRGTPKLHERKMYLKHFGYSGRLAGIAARPLLVAPQQHVHAMTQFASEAGLTLPTGYLEFPVVSVNEHFLDSSSHQSRLKAFNKLHNSLKKWWLRLLTPLFDVHFLFCRYSVPVFLICLVAR